VEIWRLSGKKLDWQALPILAEMYGVEDIECLIFQLAAIRDFEWPQTSQ
jgi:hypothetical protein